MAPLSWGNYQKLNSQAISESPQQLGRSIAQVAEDLSADDDGSGAAGPDDDNGGSSLEVVEDPEKQFLASEHQRPKHGCPQPQSFHVSP